MTIATEYPRLHQIGCNVKREPMDHVPWTELDAAIKDAGLDRERFSDLFGVQTCYAGGVYAWDAEAVLERMMSGKLTGTQRYWDQMIHEWQPPLLVHTPHGEGDALLLMDYGLNTNSVWVVRLHGGEVKHYYSPDIRIYGNPMDGRGWDVNIPEGWVK